MRVPERDSLVRKRACCGALGGIRTPDTWFRSPVPLVPVGHRESLLAPFRTCGEARNRPFVPLVPNQSQRAHGQQMVK